MRRRIRQLLSDRHADLIKQAPRHGQGLIGRHRQAAGGHQFGQSVPLIVGADSGDQGGKVGVRWYKSDLRGFAEGFGDVMPHLDAAAIVVPSPLNKERFEPEFERIADILQKRFSAKPGFRFGDVIGHDEEARGPFEQMCLKRGFHRVCLMPTVRDNARRCEWIHPSGLVVTAGALRGAPRRRGRARRVGSTAGEGIPLPDSDPSGSRFDGQLPPSGACRARSRSPIERPWTRQTAITRSKTITRPRRPRRASQATF
uniref:Uncharacterized protein n=1 Tax=Rhodopseudomonas palustris (strain ATCC BAA-98 / CGA009) TaxID=258594 RepID=Q6N7K4_RHOPA|nr:hypothetical protein RPA2253 [Rhodopseudomonas palustris CGA009]